MDTMMEAVEAVQKSTTSPDKSVRTLKKMKVGQVAQQGDIYIHCVDAKHSKGKRVSKGAQVVQVALGSNMGARHEACGNIEVYEAAQLPQWVTPPQNVSPMEICGPVIVAKAPWNLTHPEHAHHNLPAGAYQVTYQYDPKTMRRVAD